MGGELRLLHMGMGAFHRAHQADYMQDLLDAGEVGARIALERVELRR